MRDIRYPIEGVVYHSGENAGRYFSSGAWTNSTVGDALRATARRLPEKAAFISDERSLTFRELDEQSERLAAALLGMGLRPSDRAMFQMGTTVETVVALMACYKAGIVPVCSLPQHRDVEIGQLVRQTGARAYFVQADFGSFDLVAFARRMIDAGASLEILVVARAAPGQDLLGGYAQEALIGTVTPAAARERLAGTGPGVEDVLSFQLSGGTTGVPKVIPRFHAEYLGHGLACARHYRRGEDDCFLWSLPLVHNAAQLYVIVPVVGLGAAAVLQSRVEMRRMLELIELHRVTHAVSIGPVAPHVMAYADLHRHDLSSLRLFATMSRADHLEAHLGVPCSNLYGITEGLLIGSSADAPAFVRHHTQGMSGCPDDELRLLEPESEEPVQPGAMGELCFRGPATLPGFFNAPEANAQAFTSDGFYRTGDMMTAHVLEGHTYYTFEGRLRDNVNRGGEKIGCEEVEGLVSGHSSVAEAKLVAMPDPIYGEKGCVYIVPRPGKPLPTVQELADFLIAQGLAKYKCPERVEGIDAFPVTKVGKVDKPALRRMIAETLEREARQPFPKWSIEA